jgi:hypothetical protein
MGYNYKLSLVILVNGLRYECIKRVLIQLFVKTGIFQNFKLILDQFFFLKQLF